MAIRDPVAIFVLACSSISASDAYQVTYPSHLRKYLPPTNTCFKLIWYCILYFISSAVHALIPNWWKQLLSGCNAVAVVWLSGVHP